MNKIETATRRLAFALILTGAIPLAGCRICADCDELAYPAYGGAWQRTLRDSGRVGSIFDPGGARASELVSRDTPPQPDELDRQRREERGGGPDLDPDRDEDDTDEDAPERRDSKERENELRNRRLDDIEQEREDELRKRNLDDIEVRVIPGEPAPPVLH